MAVALLMLLAGACALPDGGERPTPAATGSREATPDAREAAPLGSVELVGLSSEDVLALIGPPDFRRSDGPTELLQYRGDGCVLDLFLYRDEGAATPQVAHVVTRNADLEEVPREACIAGIRRNRGVQPAG